MSDDTIDGSADPGCLAGKAGVVTGAAAGLGRAVLLAACAEGAAVVALDHDADRARETVAEAVTAGGRAVYHEGDVTREQDVVAAIQRSKSEFGAFNILDNNAGIALEKRLHDTSSAEWDSIMEVNLKGAFYGCKHGVIAMRAGSGGSIVNTGSIVSLVGDPNLPAYATTKTGLVGLTRVIAVDYAEDGIRCNIICPGDMLTPMLERTFDLADDPAAARREIENAYPVKRIADPAEVARAVVFLLSDDSSFMTGAQLVVDGGLTVKCY
jgi:NAD(P)-dependent dehydrogenase (short-subunit alcohol dehydrogenase family)